MRKLMLLTGAAAIAAALPAVAQPDERGRGRGGERVERQAERGAERAERRAERAERNAERQADRAERGAERRAEREERMAERAERARERRLEREERRLERGERDAERRFERNERRFERLERRAERRPDRDFDRLPVHAVGPEGCPPGLAKQNAFCMPPGLLRREEVLGRRLPAAEWEYNIPDRYRYRFRDDDEAYYRWDDGYVYRFDRGSNAVEAIIPVLASGLLTGEPMPLGYEVYNVPLAYRSYYPDTQESWYRYDDNAIYEVDPTTNLVQGIVALLTGSGGLGGLGIGDQLPTGYDAYNVPLDYRDRYYDTPDAMYRYADGSIYQVDPQTQLIEAVISLLG